MKKLFALLLVMILVFTSCMAKDEDLGKTESTATATNTEENATDIPRDDVSQKQTLTIATVKNSNDIATLKAAAKEFMKQNQNVEIVIVEYDSAEKYNQQVATQLMANSSTPDIINVSHYLSYETYGNRGFLANLYDFMEKEEGYFNKNNFNESVLKAAEVNGKLHIIPNTIVIQLFSISDYAPEAAKDEFKKLESATLLDLAKIYNKYNRDAENSMYFSQHLSLYFPKLQDVVNEYISTYLDFEKKTCDFDKDFIELISVLKGVYDDEGVNRSIKSLSLPPASHFLFYVDKEEQETYFYKSLNFFNLFQYILPYEGATGFTHAIPVANEDGSLYTNPIGGFAITNSKNKELAWEFLKILYKDCLKLFSNIDGDLFIKTDPKPILDSLMSVSVLQASDSGTKLRTDEGTQSEIFNTYINKIVNIFNMPKIAKYRDNNVYNLLDSVLGEFGSGFLTAEQVAKSLQNTFSIMLQE